MLASALPNGRRNGQSPLFFDARREKMAIFSGCNSRPARLLQPVVVGAVEEVTNLLRPSM